MDCVKCVKIFFRKRNLVELYRYAINMATATTLFSDSDGFQREHFKKLKLKVTEISCG